MTLFVLIHGGWQGGWCWDGVRDSLQERGFRVLVPTWLGDRDGRPIPPEDTTINKAGAQIARDVDATAGDDDVVLVGHSGGGPVAQYIAERLAARVRRVVFVDGVVLHDGEAFADVLPFPEGFADSVVPDATMPPPPLAGWAASFMNGAEPDLIEETAGRLVAVPIISLTRPVDLPRYWQSEPPASYVFLRDDIAVDRSVWKSMAERLSDPAIFECPGPHEAMITHPGELADVLVAASSL